MFQKLKKALAGIKKEIRVYKNILKDPRTPRISKLLLWLALGYLALPFDIIPDFIPGIGQLDDLIIVPALVYCALKMIPGHIIRDSRNRA